jgi:hypothetical protein
MRSRYSVLLLALIIPVSGLMAGTLTVTKDGGGDGFIRVDGEVYTLPFSQSYAAGTSVTLLAVPADQKSQFDWWSGFVNSTDNPVTITMPLFGNASISASFSASPPDIFTYSTQWQFPDAIVGGAATYKSEDIFNHGGQILYVVSMSITGPDASDFFVASVPDAFNVPPGPDGHTVTVGFHPASSGEKRATLNIFSNDPDADPYQIELIANAVILPPDIDSPFPSWTVCQALLGSYCYANIEISNSGSQTLVIVSMSITGPNASEFIITEDPIAFNLAAGATHEIEVSLFPVSAGDKSATLNIYSNDPDENPFQIGLSGKVVAPDIDSDPASWDFGPVKMGEYSDKTFTVLNNGDGMLYVSSTTITGSNASEFTILDADVVGEKYGLDPGTSRNIPVRFAPTSTGSKSASLTFSSNDSDENPFHVSLTGTGTSEPGETHPDIASNPASWDYGAVTTGSHADKTFAISNAGTADLNVTAVTLSGTDASEFYIQSGGGTFTLAPAATRNVVVRFTPTGTGSKSASLSFTSNDPDENPFNVSLSGTGTSGPGGTPDIASDPVSWDYGAVSAGSHADKTFVISNTGTADLSVTAVTLSGTDASEFHIQSGGGTFTLAPAAMRNVVVRFSPTGSGTKNASLSFTSNDPDENPFLVPLSGGGGLSIVIDGNKDGFYSTLTGPENGYVNIASPLYNLNGAPADDRDLSAKVWTAWDDTYLYVYEEVKDDTVHANNTTNWQNDCFELMIDPDPSKKATTGVKITTLTALDSTDTTPAYYAGIADLANKSDYARKRTADGYVIELRLKWSDMIVSGRGPVVPAVGNIFGLAINQHDNDRSTRQASIQWAAKLDDTVWENPQLHGKVTLQADHKLKMEARNAIDETLVNPLAALYVPNDLPWPMLTMDVGSVQKAGSASYDAPTQAYTVGGSGVDIWDLEDGFRYVFRQVSGDVELTARITGLTKSDP